jgi:hypothetical protein
MLKTFLIASLTVLLLASVLLNYDLIEINSQLILHPAECGR